jgi:aminoglycoside phosphotransferase (APT) family kinase protein
VLERTGIILRWACLHLGAEIEETVGAVVASLEEVPPAPTHRDLKLDHILLDGDRPCLVDLNYFAEADPVLDVANVGRSDAEELS